ncbi:MAG: ABC transporter ATP-binding protein [Pseudomonadota bacterium]
MVAKLSVENLTVGLGSGVVLLNDMSFDLAPGERVGLVGASGCGKSLTAGALCGLLRPPLSVLGGAVRIDGQEVLGLPQTDWRQIRGKRIFQIFQSPGTALTPARRVGPQLVETARCAGVAPEPAILEALRTVELDSQILRVFPYQLSGGMKQRILIAMAFILRPDILIADEPTTGLDVLTERGILTALNAMAAETGATLLFISHDLRAVEAMAERTLVMQAGRIVEDVATAEIGASPAPAAQRLLEAARTLQSAC